MMIAEITGDIIIPDKYVTNDYNNLHNHPTIEGVELVGDLFFEDLGLTGVSNTELEDILQL